MKVSRNKKIVAAEDENKLTLEELVEEQGDALADDFDYAMSGFDKLCRDGNCQDALDIMDKLSAAIQDAIGEISELLDETSAPEPEM